MNASNPSAGSGDIDPILGRLLVEHGLATQDEVDDCLQLHQQLAAGQSPRSLSDILVANEIVTRRQLERLKQQIGPQSRQQIPGYQILGKLGSGAMSSVFRARQMSLDREVAVKVMPQKFMSDRAYVERFLSEGRAAAKLNHPNIVQAIDVGQTPDFHFFVMEYVEGETVSDYLERHGPYEENEALRIIILIAMALQHAHAQGLMHRDIKPKNIMLTRQGVAKLADMGLARHVADSQSAEAEAGKAYGTPYYISPEQIRGDRDVDVRADIYGLGATFYHMVTGRVPFDAPTPTAVMHKHLTVDPVPPDHVNPRLSAGVSEIIEVMMAKKREDRYVSVRDLLEDLQAVARGEPPIQARQRFNIASLESLQDGKDKQPHVVKQPRPPGAIVSNPLFALLVISAILNLALIAWLLFK